MADTQALATRKQLEDMIVSRDDKGRTALDLSHISREKYNVLAPTATLMQEDPYFKPGFVVVNLDPSPDGPHFYVIEYSGYGENRKPKLLAPTKVGLTTLASAAGIEFDARSGGQEEGEPVTIDFGDGRTTTKRAYVYRAIGRIRRSDGTFATKTGEGEWDPERELLSIEVAVGSLTKYQSKEPKYPVGTPAYYAEIRRRFVEQSWAFRRPMTKSKAQNQVLREFLNLPQKFTPAEAAKPFFIVAYNFSPGDSPEMLNVVAQLAGGAADSMFGPKESLPAAEAPSAPEADEDAPLPVGQAEDVSDAEYEIVPDGSDTMEGFEQPVDPIERQSELQQRVMNKDGNPFDGKTFGEIMEHPSGPKFMRKLADLAPDGFDADTQAMLSDAREFIALLEKNGGQLV